MYDEIRKDIEEHFKDYPRKKIPRWDLAIKTLLAKKSKTKTPLAVGWLAERTGLSVPYLCNVLSGKIQDPASERLIKIAEALGISYLELFLRAMDEFRGTFFKATYSQRGIIDYRQHGFTIQSLSPPGTGMRDFFLGIMCIKPRRELKKWQFPSQCMVAVYVEEGTLEIAYGDRKETLQANEPAYFDASIPHRFKNVDDKETRLFLVTYPPIH